MDRSALFLNSSNDVARLHQFSVGYLHYFATPLFGIDTFLAIDFNTIIIMINIMTQSKTSTDFSRPLAYFPLCHSTMITTLNAFFKFCFQNYIS